MIQRVVFIRLASAHRNDATRAEVAARTREVLPGAAGVRTLDVTTVAPDRTKRDWDLCLLVRLDDMEAVEAYRVCPVHRAYADVFLAPIADKVHVHHFVLADG